VSGRVTEDRIRELARDLAPVKPIPRLRVVGAVVLATWALAFVADELLGGRALRPAADPAWASPSYLAALAGIALAALGATGAALASAATFAVGAAMTGGDVLLEGARAEHMDAIIAKLRATGAHVAVEAGGVRVKGSGEIKAVDIVTQPHPGFPTDMQAQFMTMACLAKGQSVIKEMIFENRFQHVPELNRMGAEIQTTGRAAIVRGGMQLTGASVMATDLRASASLVLAGLVAKGTTDVLRVYHLDRGYEAIEEKLRAVGAKVRREQQ